MQTISLCKSKQNGHFLGVCIGYLLIWIAVFPSFLFALPRTFLTDDITHLDLGQKIQYLEDETNALTYEQIKESSYSSKFQLSTHPVLRLPFTESTIWVRFQLTNNGKQRTLWYLKLGYPHLDKVQLYEQQNLKTLIHQKTGDHYPFDSRSIEHRHFIFPIQLPPGETHTFYFQINTSSSVQLPLAIFSPETFAEETYHHQLFLGVYFGLMLVMLAYHALLFFALQDKNYFFYTLFLGLFIPLHSTLNGFSFQYLWPSFPEMNRQAIPIFLFFTQGSILLFTRSFLNTKKYTPTLDKLLAMLIPLTFISAGISFILNYHVAVKWGSALQLVISGSMFIAGILSVKTYPPARYYLVAWSTFLFGSVLYALNIQAILPDFLDFPFILELSAATSFAFLATALANRVRVIEQERLAAEIRESASKEEVLKSQREALKSLEKANRLKDEFLANISQELQTPINSMIGISESLLDGAEGPLSDGQRNNLAMIMQSGRQLMTLISDVIDFARMKHEALKLNTKPVKLDSVVSVVISLSQTLILGKPVELKTRIPDNLPMVYADATRLQQILLNLIDNAIKFTERGEIIISAWVERRQICISVQDTGIGIPSNQQQKIFQAFEQMESASDRLVTGAGLGLTIVKRLVELHKGSIKVDSEKNQGTTFFIYLPMAQIRETSEYWQQQMALQSEISSNPPQGPRSTTEIETSETPNSKNPVILIVDHDPVQVQLLKNYLQLHNYQIFVATDGEQALEFMKHQTPDLILLEVMLPKRNGYSVCKVLRKQYDSITLPILLITAQLREGEIIRGLNLGANDYLPKPFKKEELLVRVQSQLRLKETVNALKNGERREIEMSTANLVQELLLPNEPPEIEGIELSSFYRTASETGGDWFHYHYHRKSQLVDILIGDVIGHGVSAALITAMVGSFYQTMDMHAHHNAMKKIKNPFLNQQTYLISLLNRILYNITKGAYTMSFCHSRINMKTREMTYVVAGHPPCCLWRPQPEEDSPNFIPLHIRSNLLGHLESVNFEPQSRQLQSGDVLVWYTDGLLENENSEGKRFSLHKLRQVLNEYGTRDAETIKSYLQKTALEHYGDHPWDDDITFIVAKIL